MIGQESLPETLVARCLDVLRILSPNERDLIRVVVEVVHELRDTSDPDAEENLSMTVSCSLLSLSLLIADYDVFLVRVQKGGSTQDGNESMDGDEESVTAAAPKPATLTTRGGFPKPVAEMTPEEKARADDIDLRCLSLCIGMLERVNGVSGCRSICLIGN